MSLLSHEHQEQRPWGSFHQLTKNEESTVKIIDVLPGLRFSLQTHQNRSEFWTVLTGSGVAQIGDITKDVIPGDTIEIPAGTTHRLTASSDGTRILEIAFGSFDEDDIVRLADDFNRADTSFSSV